MTAELIARCRAGDADAFRELVEPFRRELMSHCYRFLGSIHDAEDALQETLLDAWNGLGAFEARSSVRTWLYRVATNRCLKILRSAGRRPRMASSGESSARFELPEPSAHGEVVWLEPYPDLLLEGLGDPAPGPEARYESTQAISLAFVTAVQLLPPRQRAVLILRDVLGYRAADVAEFLDTTEESVTSALKRARAAMQQRAPRDAQQPPSPDSPAERLLVEQFTRAFERCDVDGVVALLADDVRLTMPPSAGRIPRPRGGYPFPGRRFRPSPSLSSGRDASQRPTGLRRLPPGRPHLRLARHGPDGPHPRRRPHHRSDPVRQQHPGPIRPPPHPPRISTAHF